jgi:hypothetical protein
MNTQPVGYKAKAFKVRNLVILFLVALVMTACSSQSSIPSTATATHPQPTPLPERQTSADDHTPVFLRVVERQDTRNGFLVHYRDLYFTDPDGDADYVSLDETSSSLSYPSGVSGGELDVPAQEQIAGAMIPIHWICNQKMDIVFASRISDRLGKVSEPVNLAFSCTTPPVVDTRSFLVKGLGVAIPFALVLLLGFWLLFRKTPSERLPALRSTLLFFCLLLVFRFVDLILHEGGHCLYLVPRDIPFTLYVHPFLLSGYCRPGINSIWSDLLGTLTSLPLAALISLLFWKRRSLALLPLVMLFPFVATLHGGVNVMGLEGDFLNIVQVNGLSPVPFYVLGGSIVLVGVLFLFALFPLLGLDPKDKGSLFVLPAAMFLNSALTFLVAYLFVPGSPIDSEYFLAQEIIAQANAFIPQTVIGLILAVLYITLYRKVAPRLPAWLRTETVALTWRDLRLPALLAAVSVILGLIIII